MDLIRSSYFKQEPLVDDVFAQPFSPTMYSSCPDLRSLCADADDYDYSTDYVNEYIADDLKKVFPERENATAEEDLEVIEALLQEIEDGLPLFVEQNMEPVETKYTDCLYAQEQNSCTQEYDWLQQEQSHPQRVPDVHAQYQQQPQANRFRQHQRSLSASLPAHFTSPQQQVPRHGSCSAVPSSHNYMSRPVPPIERSPLVHESPQFDYPRRATLSNQSSPLPIRKCHPLLQQGNLMRSASCSDVFPSRHEPQYTTAGSVSPLQSSSSASGSMSPLSHTHRFLSSSLNSVDHSPVTTSESDGYDSPDDRYNSANSLSESPSALDFNQLPYIRLHDDCASNPVIHSLGMMEDGSKLMAIPINPKTGKPKRRRRRKARNQVVPPPLLDNRSNTTLWEFFLELLLDPDNYSHLIMWVDREAGEFKIIDSEVVSVIWGLLKNKTGMKYDHMSRSIRYYYGKEILDKVPDKQLVYKFGVKSNWMAYQRKSQGLDINRMPTAPIDVCGRTAKPKHFAVARVAPPVAIQQLW